MWKNLLEKLLGLKPKEKQFKDEWVDVPCKKKINVKQAFCTIRLKNGENIISRVFKGHRGPIWSTIITGKMRLVQDFCALQAGSDSFYHITEDRLVRLSDIMDFINIVESDYEIEIDTTEKKLFRCEV